MPMMGKNMTKIKTIASQMTQGQTEA